MKLIKAAAPLALVLGLAGCTDDAEKFQGVWKGDMGIMLLINKGATEATVCVPGIMGGTEALKVVVEGNKLMSAEPPVFTAAEWREVDGKPQLTVEGQALNKVDQAEWDQNCK